ncbi:MAG: hypothetical protein AAGG01_14260 [Planctomycetota bacterium]
MLTHSAALLTAAAALTAAASAQLPSIYVDIGALSGQFGVPATGYAAAAAVGGEWNAMNTDLFTGSNPYTTPNLVDISGSVTPVTLTFDALGFPLISFEEDEPFTMGNDEALMDDIGYTNGLAELRWDGLPAGTYDVIVYAMAPDDATFLTSVNVIGSLDPLQEVGGDFSAGFALGITHSLHTVDVVGGTPLVIEVDLSSGADSVNGLQIMPAGSGSSIGASYCGPAVPNTTGAPAFMSAAGSRDVTQNDVLITCSNMPSFAFGFFIVSQTQGFVMNPGGSSGNICLAGSVGRYVGPGQVQNSGSAGQISLQLDLTMIPQPNGFVAANSGETWNWQTWYRDSTPGGTPTSNFSDGLQVDFL